MEGWGGGRGDYATGFNPFEDRPSPAPPTAAQKAAEMADAIAAVPKGWWWSVGECSVSCDATIGPDVAYCDKATLVRFDGGIMADLAQPSTPAEALRAAIATYEGTRDIRPAGGREGGA